MLRVSVFPQIHKIGNFKETNGDVIRDLRFHTAESRVLEIDLTNIIGFVYHIAPINFKISRFQEWLHWKLSPKASHKFEFLAEILRSSVI
jgi:hypothetical protein